MARMIKMVYSMGPVYPYPRTSKHAMEPAGQTRSHCLEDGRSGNASPPVAAPTSTAPARPHQDDRPYADRTADRPNADRMTDRTK